jgi:hypothetical protein
MLYTFVLDKESCPYCKVSLEGEGMAGISIRFQKGYCWMGGVAASLS